MEIGSLTDYRNSFGAFAFSVFLPVCLSSLIFRNVIHFGGVLGSLFLDFVSWEVGLESLIS